MKNHSFPPLAGPYSRVLILGTMPDIRFLELQQYYGHPQNAFWKIVSSVLHQSLPRDYSARKKLLIHNQIAVWDVLQYCERKGSLDSAIRNEVPNDIAFFKIPTRHYPYTI